MSKAILITGATDGIGLLTAQKLATAGHTVLVHGRSAEKLSAAAETIGGEPKTYRADLSKVGEVKALADAVLADVPKLDVLINNAGVLKAHETQTDAGRDIRFDVNTIAPYLLTRSLLPIIPAEGRVVNLSSAAQAPVNVEAMRRFSPMADMDAYAQSKLAITIWTAELAKLHPDGPAMIAVNPGSLLASKMVQEGFGVAGSDLNIGADILIAAALDHAFADASGKYFDNDSGRFARPHSSAMDPKQISTVMQALAELA